VDGVAGLRNNEVLRVASILASIAYVITSTFQILRGIKLLFPEGIVQILK